MYLDRLKMHISKAPGASQNVKIKSMNIMKATLLEGKCWILKVPWLSKVYFYFFIFILFCFVF